MLGESFRHISTLISCKNQMPHCTQQIHPATISKDHASTNYEIENVVLALQLLATTHMHEFQQQD